MLNKSVSPIFKLLHVPQNFCASSPHHQLTLNYSQTLASYPGIYQNLNHKSLLSSIAAKFWPNSNLRSLETARVEHQFPKKNLSQTPAVAIETCCCASSKVKPKSYLLYCTSTSTLLRIPPVTFPHLLITTLWPPVNLATITKQLQIPFTVHIP